VGGTELMRPVLPREFFAGSAVEVAPLLLGCVLEHETAAGRVAVLLTEVEAYAGAADPASHAFRGRTARNAVMFGPPGHAYVYFTYGMHFCVNLVCLPAGEASAVLLRAGRVIEGAGLAARRRRGRGAGAGGPAADEDAGAPALPERDLARGPARLCQALGIDRSLDGADVCAPGSPLRVTQPPGGAARPRGAALPGNAALPGGTVSISRGPRVGVSSAAEVEWRFWIAGEAAVTPYRPYVRRHARPKSVAGRQRRDGTIPG
jgi:DNA-3-methyladenine glycosylase